jgi:mono/diheme cytochrome c family protein
MFRTLLIIILSTSTMILSIFISGVVLAQDPPSAAVEQGALAYSNWTKTDAGGSGALPTGVDSQDYIRCKACHGWDRYGTWGGYARRSRKDSRPNAGAGDGDVTPRVIPGTSPRRQSLVREVVYTDPDSGNITCNDINQNGICPEEYFILSPLYLVTADMVTHAGTGRAYTDGMASWVALDGTHSAANKAAHANGYTLGNQHPDFTIAGGLTQTQIDNLVAFLNYDDGKPGAYFSNIDPSVYPVLYTIVDSAEAAAGETYYNANCNGCHGDPATDHDGLNGGHPDGGLLAYLVNDGKFSEFAHKARWGIPNTIMDRSTMGSPTSQNIADVMLYLQELGGTGFAINSGLSGNWWGGATRSGEGFLIDVALNGNGGTIMVVSFYTYDSIGNQVWLIGAGPINGNTAVIDLMIPSGAKWGTDFNPNDNIETPWGTGTFKFTSCAAGNIALAPNMEMQNNLFTDLSYDINRDILVPGVACPNQI